MITFGPIPSRRLGRSLGINNIPPKVCTYSCIYCQVGRTIKVQMNHQAFFEPADIRQAVEEKIAKVQDAGEAIDYLTFVPDGEPTLDINLGREIDLLRPLRFKIAVISNASLIWREDVRKDLMKADWVSLKVDSVNEAVWRTVNRPHRSLQLSAILEAMLQFAHSYKGKLTTETMLVKGVNDSPEHAEEIADFLSQLNPNKAYVSIPTRPPSETWVQPPNERMINAFYQILNRKVEHLEYLIGYEGNRFALTGDAGEDLLSITAVHPMREEAVREVLRKAKASWAVVEDLMDRGLLVETEYEGNRYFMRRFSNKPEANR